MMQSGDIVQGHIITMEGRYNVHCERHQIVSSNCFMLMPKLDFYVHRYYSSGQAALASSIFLFKTEVANESFADGRSQGDIDVWLSLTVNMVSITSSASL